MSQTSNPKQLRVRGGNWEFGSWDFFGAWFLGFGILQL
jgi:hypothetical protein